MASPLSGDLLKGAANNRHGLVLAPQTARLSRSDIPGIVHVGVPSSVTGRWKSAAGGVSRDPQAAVLSAVGEGVERYCAAVAEIPLNNRADIPQDKCVPAETWTLFSDEQRGRSDFPFGNLYSEQCKYTEAYELGTDDAYWVPHPLVVLRDDYETGIPTSSGLAAGPSAATAALRALQELIERDALMTTWLHSLPGRSLAVPDEYMDQTGQLGGEVHVFDLTPAYSPFPVIAVMGGVPSRGRWRYSLGVACRESLGPAIDKAFLEWCQGVFFAGVYPKYVTTDSLTDPKDVNTFDDHAIFYTRNPRLWNDLPILKRSGRIAAPRLTGKVMAAPAALKLAVGRLRAAGVRLYYRDLTSIDALQAGVRVVRVLSPDLVPINAHQDWPFLGGTAKELQRRYPRVRAAGPFPNPFPHPLG